MVTINAAAAASHEFAYAYTVYAAVTVTGVEIGERFESVPGVVCQVVTKPTEVDGVVSFFALVEFDWACVATDELGMTLTVQYAPVEQLRMVHVGQAG
jgi:hypothetical protein